MSEYILNMETLKLELHFEKADYLALDDSQKAQIKSNFLFSRRSGAWVSRCKYPRTSYAESIAIKLGLENGGKQGEYSFEAEQERKAEKAEHRAERYTEYAHNAADRAETLQKPINDMNGDISFFTQPNINSSAGRAFTNRRNRMWASYDKGIEEFRKSEYYKERAKKALNNSKAPTDKSFIQRRIDDAQKEIRSAQKWLDKMDPESASYERQLDILDIALSKLAYYDNLLVELGGLAFSKDNINKGDIVTIQRWGRGEVISKGPKNITFKYLDCKALEGFTGKAAYAEILAKES